MVFPLKLALNWTMEMETLQAPSYKNFRFFMTGRDTATTPQWDLPPKPQCDTQTDRCNEWLTVTDALEAKPKNKPETAFIADFSAVCLLTIRDLTRIHKSLKYRPLALIQSAWGGTRIEAWMSTEAIESTGSYSQHVPSRFGNQENQVCTLQRNDGLP